MWKAMGMIASALVLSALHWHIRIWWKYVWHICQGKEWKLFSEEWCEGEYVNNDNKTGTNIPSHMMIEMSLWERNCDGRERRSHLPANRILIVSLLMIAKNIYVIHITNLCHMTICVTFLWILTWQYVSHHITTCKGEKLCKLVASARKFDKNLIRCIIYVLMT